MGKEKKALSLKKVIFQYKTYFDKVMLFLPKDINIFNYKTSSKMHLTLGQFLLIATKDKGSPRNYKKVL